jgi:hypothetical protein
MRISHTAVVLAAVILCSALSAGLVRALTPPPQLPQAQLASNTTGGTVLNREIRQEVADLNTIHQDLVALNRKTHGDSLTLAGDVNKVVNRLDATNSGLDNANTKLDGIAGKLDAANGYLNTGLFSTSTTTGRHARLGWANWLLGGICGSIRKMAQDDPSMCDSGKTDPGLYFVSGD